jgi:putative Holliday junction resolvase
VVKVSTLLCFDFGLSNIGVAVGNTLTREARPLAVLDAHHGKPNWDRVGSLIVEWLPNSIVVGSPIDEAGEHTELSEKAARFARKLEGRFRLPVILHDERFSSKEAKLRAKETGHNGDYSKSPVDDLAAAVILESWLRAQTNG